MKPPVVTVRPIPVMPSPACDGCRRLCRQGLEACGTALITVLLDRPHRVELMGLRLGDVDLNLDALLVPGKAARARFAVWP